MFLYLQVVCVKLGHSAEPSTWCSVHAESPESETPSSSSSDFVTETVGTFALLEFCSTKYEQNLKTILRNICI